MPTVVVAAACWSRAPGVPCMVPRVRVARQTERDVMGERQIQERRGEDIYTYGNALKLCVCVCVCVCVLGAANPYTEANYKPAFLSDDELKQLILKVGNTHPHTHTHTHTNTPPFMKYNALPSPVQTNLSSESYYIFYYLIFRKMRATMTLSE